jgi:hypothetical protein
MRHMHRPHPQVFQYPGGAELWGLASWCGSRTLELANGLRLGTVVPSQDLSGACVTVSGRELARPSASP